MAYQNDKGLNPTGKLDIETMISLNNSTSEGWKRPEPERKMEKQDGSPSHSELRLGREKNNLRHYTVLYDVNAALNRGVSHTFPKNSVFHDQVKESQKQLKQMGFDIGPEGVDGQIGKHTAQAIKDFQNVVHLPATGELDKATVERMENEFKKGKLDQKFRTMEGQQWKVIHTGQNGEYAAFEYAKSLDEEAAYKSLGMGIGQIQGENYTIYDYNSAKDMGGDICRTEYNR